MINAYLFINLDPSYSGENILAAVRDIPQVKEAHRLYGTYDMVVYMEVKDTDELKTVTIESVRKLQFVDDTVTFVALDSYFVD